MSLTEKNKQTGFWNKEVNWHKPVGKRTTRLGIWAIFISIMIFIFIIPIIFDTSTNEKRSSSPATDVFKIENVPQAIKDKMTTEQLKQFVNIINKSTPEFRQTFALDYGKELAQKNKTIALGLWAKSLGIPVNYQMDDAWEIYGKIKTKSNDFSIYRDGVKFLEFIVTVTDKSAGAGEYTDFLEKLFK